MRTPPIGNATGCSRGRLARCRAWHRPVASAPIEFASERCRRTARPQAEGGSRFRSSAAARSEQPARSRQVVGGLHGRDVSTPGSVRLARPVRVPPGASSSKGGDAELDHRLLAQIPAHRSRDLGHQPGQLLGAGGDDGAVGVRQQPRAGIVGRQAHRQRPAEPRARAPSRRCGTRRRPAADAGAPWRAAPRPAGQGRQRAGDDGLAGAVAVGRDQAERRARISSSSSASPPSTAVIPVGDAAQAAAIAAPRSRAAAARRGAEDPGQHRRRAAHQCCDRRRRRCRTVPARAPRRWPAPVPSAAAGRRTVSRISSSVPVVPRRMRSRPVTCSASRSVPRRQRDDRARGSAPRGIGLPGREQRRQARFLASW